MRQVLALGLLACLLAGCAATGQRAADADAVDPIATAIADPDRPPEDRVRDATRHPDAVLRLAGVQPGQRVFEMVAAEGYYTELLARAVGADGNVYASRLQPARLAGNRLPNVQQVDDTGPANGDLDLVITALNYHDMVNLDIQRNVLLAGLLKLLRPGGRLLVVDHAAAPGSGARDVGTLHRIDPQLVLDEVLAAGFVLVSRSNVLGNPADDHSLRVFDPAIRGHTDRFVLLFKKPAGGS